MFQGTIPAPMRSIVRETAQTWPRERGLWVPCAGNLTIERSVADLGFELHSSDVSIYTSAVGRWLAGQPCGVRLREDAEDLGWLAEGLDDGPGTVATLMLGTRFLGSVAKAREGHRYHRRVVNGYRAQWETVHAATVDRLRQVGLRLASYDAEDVRSWLDRVPVDAPVCSFPPFYGGGYETLYRPLDQVFEWDAPEYDVLTEDDVAAVLRQITDRPYWLTASNHWVQELEGNLRGVIKASPRAAPFYVYAAAASSRIVAPRQMIRPVTVPRLGEAELTGDLSLSVLPAPQFNALRSKYLNPHIPPGSAHLAVAVRDAGRLVGVWAILPPKYDPTCAYLLSDFPVAPTRYKHLAKLVLVAATSTEAQRLIQRAVNRRITAVATTAFTNNPVSMKYRGLFSLTKRASADDPAWKYMLNYERAIGTHTLAEGWDMWSRRWGKLRPGYGQEAAGGG